MLMRLSTDSLKLVFCFLCSPLLGAREMIQFDESLKKPGGSTTDQICTLFLVGYRGKTTIPLSQIFLS